MIDFLYTQENLTEIERTLSSDRLTPYLAAVGGDLEAAVRLYEQNTLLSESLHGILQGLEITLRNAIHAQLSASLGQGNWYEALKLGPEHLAMLRRAKESLQRDGKPRDARAAWLPNSPSASGPACSDRSTPSCGGITWSRSSLAARCSVPKYKRG